MGSRSQGRRLVLLAPPDYGMASEGPRGREDSRYDGLLAGMQRLRGSIYLKDGAIHDSQLTNDGRHVSPADARGWHVLLVEGNGEVKGCARCVSYPEHVSFGWLGVSRCPLALSDRWGLIFRHAVEREMSSARLEGMGYMEIGGWALAEDLRCTTEALRIALSCYALGHCLGGCLGISTATWRHGSSSILRRIGGRPLEIAGIEMPAYFDPSYDCQMEVLRFDSRELNYRYKSLVADLSDDLCNSVLWQPAMRPSAEPIPWPVAEPVCALAV